MRPRAGGAAALLVVALATGAQAQLADFNGLRTPSSPAWVLLGIEPVSVERPNTPADFAASILNATSNLTAVPKDFALEVSPYWMFSHPRHSWRDDIRRSLGQSIARTATIAVATADVGTTAAPVRGVAFSVRTSLLSGRMADSTVAAIRRLERELAESSAVEIRRLGRAFDSLLAGRMAAARTMAESTAALQQFTLDKAEVIARAESSRVVGAGGRELQRRAARLPATREGVMVDLAAGGAWRAPSASYDSATFDRFGVWLTVTYQLPNVSFLGMSRYLGFQRTDEDALDIGGRFIITRERYALSLEYVGRHFGADTTADQ